MRTTKGKEKAGSQRRRVTGLLAGLSDAAVLKRACERDVAAFEDLVLRTEEDLYRLAMRYVHNESDAQEILQNAYLSAWRGLPSFEGRAQFASWMHRITVNASLMFLRARGRHCEIGLDDVEPTTLNVAMVEATHGPTLRRARVASPRPSISIGRATRAHRQRGELASSHTERDVSSARRKGDVDQGSGRQPGSHRPRGQDATLSGSQGASGVPRQLRHMLTLVCVSAEVRSLVKGYAAA